MTVVLWVIIIALFILSFAGLVFPIIPSVLALWGGFILYAFAISREELSLFFWIGAIVLTIIIFIADIVANQVFVKKYGGSKWGERLATIGVIAGAFIYPPFGVILVPFILVFAVEWYQVRDGHHAFRVAFASFIAFLSSTFAKGLIQLILVVWFLLEVLI